MQFRSRASVTSIVTNYSRPNGYPWGGLAGFDDGVVYRVCTNCTKYVASNQLTKSIVVN